MLIKSFGRHFLLRATVIAAVQVAFVVAKLMGLLTWPWLWVFVPLLLTGTVLAIVLCMAAVLIFMSD